MKRPLGVTVLACLYLLVAFSNLLIFIPSQTFNPLQHPRLLALSAGVLIIAVTLGIALLRMKKLSRWLAITFNAAQLLSVLYRVAVHHSSIDVRVVLGTLFALCVIWYLTRPRVKTAFQSA